MFLHIFFTLNYSPTSHTFSVRDLTVICRCTNKKFKNHPDPKQFKRKAEYREQGYIHLSNDT